VKTGRLIKFHRPGGDVQAYIFRDGDLFCASVFVTAPAARREPSPQTLTGRTEAEVEERLRQWIEAHFPAKS
jgi:hypothetical protein